MQTRDIVLGVVGLVIIAGVIYAARGKVPMPREDLLATPSPLPTFSTEPDTSSLNQLNATSMPITQADIKPINHTVHVTLSTSKGDIQLDLDGAAAPLTVGNFVYLAQQHFYDGVAFHRVIPDFMIQGGDPLSKDQSQRALHGTGGPGYEFKDEINSRKLVRGSIAMANSGPNTNGSQFFIVVADQLAYLDGKHTNFGSVTAGMDVVDAIVHVPTDGNDNPLEPVVIKSITVKDPGK